MGMDVVIYRNFRDNMENLGLRFKKCYYLMDRQEM